MTAIATRKMTELHEEIATKWGISAVVIADTTFGLGVAKLLETGHTEDQIVEKARAIVAQIAEAARDRRSW